MTTDIPNGMTAQEIQCATTKADHLQQLRANILRGWLESENEVLQQIRSYWAFRDYLLACKSMYWIGMNGDIKFHIKSCSTFLECQLMQFKEKFISH